MRRARRLHANALAESSRESAGSRVGLIAKLLKMPPEDRPRSRPSASPKVNAIMKKAVLACARATAQGRAEVPANPEGAPMTLAKAAVSSARVAATPAILVSAHTTDLQGTHRGDQGRRRRLELTISTRCWPLVGLGARGLRGGGAAVGRAGARRGETATGHVDVQPRPRLRPESGPARAQRHGWTGRPDAAEAGRPLQRGDLPCRGSRHLRGGGEAPARLEGLRPGQFGFPRQRRRREEHPWPPARVAGKTRPRFSPRSPSSALASGGALVRACAPHGAVGPHALRLRRSGDRTPERQDKKTASRLTAESRLLLLAHQAKLRDDILPREEELGERVSPLPELCFGRAAGQHARLGADIKYRAAPVRQGNTSRPGSAATRAFQRPGPC